MAETNRIFDNLVMIEGSFEYCGIWFDEPQFKKKDLIRLPDFEFKKDDVVIATWPKSGTTWMTAILISLYEGGVPDKKTEKKVLAEKIGFLEFSGAPERGIPGGMDMLQSMPSPRLIKTHMRPEFLSPTFHEVKPKIIFVTRNPKDALVSFFHHYDLMFQPKITWDQFFDLFIHNRLQYGDWCDFILAWWPYLQSENVLHISYEEILKDPKQSINKVANHIGRPLDTEVIEKIVNYTSFKEMKSNPEINTQNYLGSSNFFRKGVTGDYKNHFTIAQNEYFDEYFERKMKGSGCHFGF